MRKHALCVITLGLAVAVVACGSQDAPAPVTPPEDAAASESGVGDPYFPDLGNGGYDARHYDLAVRYDPGSGELTGTATMTAAATRALASFNLDFHGLTLDEVTVDGAAARTSRAGTELTVTPTAPLSGGQTFTVVSRYHGVPGRFGRGEDSDGFFATSDGATVVGEPRAAASWFPVNDHPRDKATYSFAVTAPEPLVAITNGVPKGRESRDGWTTWRYEESAPMASYLATMNVGDFDLRVVDHRGIPMVYAVNRSVPEDRRREATERLDRTGEVIDLLAGWFGPYPFASAGGVVTSPEVRHDALENQTRPVYSERRLSEELLVHELAHQWFGDSVSLTSWKDMWLNEGFATYAEWMYDEHRGKSTTDDTFRKAVDKADRSLWRSAPGDPGADNLFGDAVYIRGAMTLHTLRRAVGDEAFFNTLREWTSSRRHGNGTTAEFIEVAGRVSGRDLREHFTAWLYTPSKPPIPAGLDPDD